MKSSRTSNITSSLTNLVKLAIGVGLLYFLYAQLRDPVALWDQVAASDKRLLLFGLLCYSAAVALSGIKWGVLLKAAGIHVTLTRLLTYQWVAEFFNNFLPAQVGGDVMRGYALANDTRRTADAAASVLIDRFIGLLIFMAAAAAAAIAMLLWGRPDGAEFSPEQAASVQWIAVSGGLVTLALLVGLVAILSRRLKLLVERLLARLPLSARTVPIWQKLAVAFHVYRAHPGALLLSALGSAAIVVLTSVNIWFISHAIQPGSITLLDVLAINPIIVFVALVLPLSPGGLGVRQGAFAATFILVGAGGELGFAVGVMQQFMVYLVSVPGGIFWMRSGSRAAVPPRPIPSDA